MSHCPGTDKYPHPEFDFDHWIIGVLEGGKPSDLLRLSAEDLDIQGETELLEPLSNLVEISSSKRA
jgi:2,3-dihydroxyphenylpropionate 1,2-dioxygenase